MVIFWLICSSITKTEQGEVIPKDKPLQTRAKGCFGVRVSIGANSTMCTYACWLDNGRVLTNKRLYDRDSFIKVVSGEWPSIYNPERINYFEENNVACGVAFDSTYWKDMTYCVPMDSLWKIRFGTYPFKFSSEIGWSNKYHKPSPKQEKYIYDRYGVRDVDAEFFLDTSFWRLLQDVSDTAWIKNYKSLL